MSDSWLLIPKVYVSMYFAPKKRKDLEKEVVDT